MNEIKGVEKRMTLDGDIYVEIWAGARSSPAYSFYATKTEIANEGNAVRIYTSDGEIFETSIHNVVMQLLGKEKEKFLQPK